MIGVPQGGEVVGAPAVWVQPSSGTTWVFVATSGGIAAFTLSTAGQPIRADGKQIPILSKVWQHSAGGFSPLIANGVLYYAGSNYLHAARSDQRQRAMEGHHGREHTLGKSAGGQRGALHHRWERQPSRRGRDRRLADRLLAHRPGEHGHPDRYEHVHGHPNGHEHAGAANADRHPHEHLYRYPGAPTATNTATNTPAPATATASATSTRVPPTATSTATNTPARPTSTPRPTRTPRPTATATQTPCHPAQVSTRQRAWRRRTARGSPSGSSMSGAAAVVTARSSTPRPPGNR